MEQRINFQEKGQGALKTLFHTGAYLKKSLIDEKLITLVDMRVSQINGCAYCLDMHSKDALAHGEDAQRLFTLNAWRETPFFTDRERAALAWAEAVTAAHVPDDVYARVKEQFTDEELVDLTLAVSTINTWNRFNIAFTNPAAVGTYRAGQFG
ncbi:carboxymuconolactone decarboxylase family protein [Chitinophaga niabensis]|uniref:Alkylhydroperoxidase AhpD family core domain-containing protein n=1 Tax=Chitinophaga niabensis TaxID=536979 RepID=A0A1N6G071_9BACT|nr:carboxymuconolactone decarboxylase family protein [Chitinophaga niabensis]SIO00842.1 alkylhydroperoxidase AhpD family core domain-containing protein [Chitinophaga niabensis]